MFRDRSIANMNFRVVHGSSISLHARSGGGLIFMTGGLSAFLGLVPLVGVLSRRDKP